MKLSNLLAAKKISISGYGVEGKAAEKFCKKNCPTVPRKIIESVTSSMKDDGSVWIVSPGIPRKYFSNIPVEMVTSGTEIFFDSLSESQRSHVIGISGTKGKSTTTKFCTEALNIAEKKAVAAGNFGVPLLEIFDSFTTGDIDYVVAELSSYQLENLQTSPGIAIFLNIFSDHLDRHGSFSEYEKAKSNLWVHQKSSDKLFLPDVLKKSFNTVAEMFHTKSLNPDIFPEDSSFRADHWCQNFGTIQALFQELHISNEFIEQTAKQFSGLPHRLQKFSTVKNRTWWDDSICTNPEAAIATVKFFETKLGALILGGQDRGMDYSSLSKAIPANTFIVILESELTARLKKDFPKAIVVPTFDEAVSQILENTVEETNIVLCPAAPSYDTFKNFKEKGKLFQHAVAHA